MESGLTRPFLTRFWVHPESTRATPGHRSTRTLVVWGFGLDIWTWVHAVSRMAWLPPQSWWTCPSVQHRKHQMPSLRECRKTVGPPAALSGASLPPREIEVAPGPDVFPFSAVVVGSIFLSQPLGVNDLGGVHLSGAAPQGPTPFQISPFWSLTLGLILSAAS